MIQNNLSLESRLLEVETNLTSDGPAGLLKLRIDFALRLMDRVMPQRHGAALPDRKIHAETVEAMFDLAGRLIQRVEQVRVPSGSDDTVSGPELPSDISTPSDDMGEQPQVGPG